MSLKKTFALGEDQDEHGRTTRKREHMTSVSSETGFSLELEELEEDTESPTSPVESPRVRYTTHELLTLGSVFLYSNNHHSMSRLKRTTLLF